MRLKYGDSVIIDGKRDRIGIIDGRSGTKLRVRLPLEGATEEVPRARVEGVAAMLASAVSAGKRYSNSFSFNGRSSLSDLVTFFGYTADVRLRSDTLDKVEAQLARAGIRLQFESQHRDAPFWLAKDSSGEVEDEDEPGEAQGQSKFALPDPYWPQALGLERNKVLQFLRSLTARAPIACVLYTSSKSPEWLVPTWEGLMSWAYRGAQRFEIHDDEDVAVAVRPYGSLACYVKPSAIQTDTVALDDKPRRLNLVVVDGSVELKELSRFKARWPGPVYEFTPDGLVNAEQAGTTSTTALLRLLRVVGGRIDEPSPSANPLKVLLWAADSCRQLTAATTAAIPNVLNAKQHVTFRGSNETSTALSLKIAIAAWLQSAHPGTAFSFERRSDDDEQLQRFDVVASNVGVFEAETLLGSGPLEAFLQQKVLSRQVGKQPLHVVVPNDALLWAGPFLAEISFRLSGRGGLMVPCMLQRQDGTPVPSLMQLDGAELSAFPLELPDPLHDSGRKDEPVQEAPAEVRLSSVAGYRYVHSLVEEEIIWPRRHPALARSASRSGAVLMFGPPGCGKSHLARAMCGELENEARMLGPADLKGLFIGWGAILVREQFDWLLEAEGRVLVIDEFDAVARSRRTNEMHADEKADVNEMLVQLDRAARAGRLVVCTTNFVNSLDEAAIRSGRFGHFVPVGPPDFEAGAAIVNHYLQRLRAMADSAVLTLTIPSADEVQELVNEAMRGTAESGLYCGADLEEVVNRTYRRLVREAKCSATGSPRSALDVTVTVAALRYTFERVRRSITSNSLEAFREDLELYAPQDYREQLLSSLTSLYTDDALGRS